MSASQVYPEFSGQTSRNGKPKKPEVPANVPEDPLFEALYAERIVGYQPLLSRALKLSEDVPKRLKDRHLERATIFLSNLIYWTPKSGAAGWIYKSVEEIEEETDLSRRAQDGARELLRKAGVLEERRKREVYFRVGWGGLKPLLRLAVQARHVEHGNQVRHVERGGNDRHVEQSTTYDMSSAEKDRHVERASSVSTTRDKQPVQDQSSTHASEAEDGGGESFSDNRGSIDDGLIDSLERKDTPAKEDAGRNPSEGTFAEEGHAPSEIGGEGRSRERSGATVGPSLESIPRSLPGQIRREMESLSSSDISEEVRLLAKALAKALGREQADAGIVRIAGYAAHNDFPELLGELAARSGEVRHPLPFCSKSLAQAVKEEEVAPREPRQGSIAERFESAYTASRPDNNQRSEKGRASSDTEGRRSLTGRNMTPIYGIGNSENQQQSAPAFRRRKPRRDNPESRESP